MAWSSKPCRQPSIKDDLLVKLYALEDIDISALLEQIALRIEQHQSKLVTFKRIKERYYDDKTLSVNQKGKLIALEMGIKEETNRIQLLHCRCRVNPRLNLFPCR